MNKRVLSDLQEELIRINCNSMSFDAIAKIIGSTYKRVQYYIYRNHLRSRIGRPFTPHEIEFIITHYKILSYKEIGKQIDRSADSIKHKCQTNGWKRTNDEVNMIQNKYCSTTQFKKNHLPGNTLFDGAIRTRKDNRGVPYKYIRLSKARWEYLHIYNWEKINGPVPKGMVLRSKDEDSLNCDPNNWELITKHEHLIRNSGRDELTDNYILNILTIRDKTLKEDIKSIPGLIDLKREQLKLRRIIYERTKGDSEKDSGNERKAISIQEL